MQKTWIMIAATLSLGFQPSHAVAFQKTESSVQAKADARTAATEAETATRKAATAINLALKTSAKEDVHTAAERIRAAVAEADSAAKLAVDKTEQAYQKAIAENQEFAVRASLQKADTSTKDAVTAGNAAAKAAWKKDMASSTSKK